MFILLNLLDSFLTYLGITSGKCEEGNILFQKIFEENIFLGLGIKMLLAIIFALVIRKWKSNLFKILNFIFILIVIWNFILFIYITNKPTGGN